MRVLVTGGSGSLGQAVCQALVGAGHEPVVYDRLEPAAAAVYRPGDIRDREALHRAAVEERVTGIVHLAALLTPESSADPPAAVAINCGGMVNALEVARELGIRRFVWASSAGVFRGHPNERSIPNDAAYLPTTVYDGTKVLNEVMAAHYHERYGIETVGLRFPLMVGAGKTRGGSGVISQELIDKPLRGEPGRPPFGRGGANWLWIEDAARVIVLALTGPVSASRHLNVSGDIRSIGDAASIMRELLPDADIVLGDQVWERAARMETAAVEAELGFRPEWPLERQLGELVRRAGEAAR